MIVDVAAAVLWETVAGRRQAHRACTWRPCDTRLVVGGRELLRSNVIAADRSRFERRCELCGASCQHPATADLDAGALFVLTGDCACSTYLSDALVSAFAYLKTNRSTITNPPAAARRHVRSRQHDHVRARRAAKGAQVRTDRLETGAIGRGLPTREQRWLLRDIAEEAGSDAPLESEAQLLHRLAVLRARRTGEDPAGLQPQVLSDLEVVRAACSSRRQVNVGERPHDEYVTWWEAYIERPLGRRTRTSDLPLAPGMDDTDAWIATGPMGPVGPPATEFQSSSGEQFLEVLYRLVARSGRASASEVLGAALGEAARAHLVDPEVIADFLADSARRNEAIAAAKELKGAQSGLGLTGGGSAEPLTRAVGAIQREAARGIS